MFDKPPGASVAVAGEERWENEVADVWQRPDGGMPSSLAF